MQEGEWENLAREKELERMEYATKDLKSMSMRQETGRMLGEI